jgi:flagellar hook-basal body complex protein FliE
MIESVSGIGPASVSAGVRSPTAAAAPTQGPRVDTLQAGEAVAIQGVEGAVSPMKVVDSVMAAQRSLQSVLAIRDKAVSAYQEVARMAI